jgi:hypothetical protein
MAVDFAPQERGIIIGMRGKLENPVCRGAEVFGLVVLYRCNIHDSVVRLDRCKITWNTDYYSEISPCQVPSVKPYN